MAHPLAGQIVNIDYAADGTHIDNSYRPSLTSMTYSIAASPQATYYNAANIT